MEPVETDDIYRNLTPGEIPWNIETPPAELVNLVSSGKISPCKAIDLGCGTGNYAIYLDSRGFTVTGVDISPRAIEISRENALEKKAGCSFVAADLTGDISNLLKEKFGFAFEWEVLHHVYPEGRKRYVENVYNLLNPGGIYFAVCFSEQDTSFPGTGKYRQTRIGTLLYFSSEDELRELYSPYFIIHELKTVWIVGKSAGHTVNYALLERKA